MKRITQIQIMSIHDGSGMETTIFTKGCNMRCAWFHNLETWEASL
ncbi:4Fe-4S cluster-binding domain-containing protein [Labilibaculum antarcticum]|nr:4Fe-4S cluster-binding domain-containing protein [Labilibaculum antarcticum]